MDKIVLEIGESKEFIYLSRVKTETGGDPATVFWKAAPIASLGVDIIKDEKVVFTINEPNELIEGLKHYPVSLVDLEFEPHTNIAQKIEGLKALKTLKPSSDGGGASAGIEVPGFGVEYKTGRTLNGKEEFAQNFEYIHNNTQDLVSLAGVSMQDMPLTNINPESLQVKFTSYVSGDNIHNAPPLRIDIHKRFGKVSMKNHTGVTFRINTLQKFRYTVLYTKTGA